jgi:hypothetical protein
MFIVGSEIGRAQEAEIRAANGIELAKPASLPCWDYQQIKRYCRTASSSCPNPS